MIQIAERVNGITTILTISGRLDIQARKPVQMAVRKAQSAGVRDLTLNLSEVTFIDSSAVGVLILAHRALEECHIKLSLIVPPGVVLDTLKLMNIGAMMPLQESELATTTPSFSYK